MKIEKWVIFLAFVFLSGCEGALNDPYPNKGDSGRTYYTSFSERPKHLDPAKSYSSNLRAPLGVSLSEAAVHVAGIVTQTNANRNL